MDNNEKLITLSNLIHYDEQLKKWIVDKLPSKASELVFNSRDDFPAQGREGILYISQGSTYKWDSVTNNYVNIASPTWEEI